QQIDSITHGTQVAGTRPSPDSTEYSSFQRDASPVAAGPTRYTSDEPAAGGTVIQGTGFASGGPQMVDGMQQVTTRTERLGLIGSMENRQQLSDVPDDGLTRPPEGVDAGVTSRAAYSPDDHMSGIRAEPTSGTSHVGDPVVGTPQDDAPYDDKFREDYDVHYANTGASYDEYRRAYTHGATLGQDERYRGHDWQGVEPIARENWESHYPESGWERFKAAVRHGWDRVTGG
ncbi:MAG TPA: hypothetical protein VF534_31245, partial [Paraburkholderia sp.]